MRASPLPVTLDVDEPLTVGADRIVNVLAAVELFRADAIVVDFGTATTFDCVTADARFLGGAIMPGLRTSADQLTRRAAKLPATELAAPARVIGRRTEECIQAGVLFGAADAVDGMVRRIMPNGPAASRPRVVATGGLAAIVAPLTHHHRAHRSRPHPARDFASRPDTSVWSGELGPRGQAIGCSDPGSTICSTLGRPSGPSSRPTRRWDTCLR